MWERNSNILMGEANLTTTSVQQRKTSIRVSEKEQRQSQPVCGGYTPED